MTFIDDFLSLCLTMLDDSESIGSSQILSADKSDGPNMRSKLLGVARNLQCPRTRVQANERSLTKSPILYSAESSLSQTIQSGVFTSKENKRRIYYGRHFRSINQGYSSSFNYLNWGSNSVAYSGLTDIKETANDNKYFETLLGSDDKVLKQALKSQEQLKNICHPKASVLPWEKHIGVRGLATYTHKQTIWSTAACIP